MPITFKDLQTDSEVLNKLKNLSPEAQDTVFNRLLPESMSDEARQIVRNKILISPVIDTNTGQSDVPPEWRDVPLEALKNIPRSTIELGKNIYQAVRHPIQTGKTLGTIGKGGIQKLTTGEQPAEQSFDAMVEFFKNRFGGEEALRRTISQDPVGFLTDVSAVLSGVGAGVSATGKIGKLGQISKVGQTISKVGVGIDPIAGPAKGLSKLASKEIPRLSKSFVKSAVKPTVSSKLTETQRLTKVDQFATEFINRGLKLNRKEIARLGEGIKEAQNNIGNIIKEGTRGGVKIKTSNIVKSLDDLINEYNITGLKTPEVSRNIKFIERIKAETLKNTPEFLTPTQAQKFKVFQNKKFAPNIETAVDAIKKVANDKLRVATKSVLEDKFPQLKTLNENQGIMIELQKAIAKRIKFMEEQPSVGVRGLVAGGGGAAAGAIATGAGGGSALDIIYGGVAFGVGSVIVEKIVTSPNIQIKLAKAINQANKILARTGSLGIITKPAFQAGRIAGITETPQGRTQPQI